MSNKILVTIFMTLISLKLYADTVAEFEMFLEQIKTLDRKKKIEALGEYVARNPNEDTALTASLLQQCYLIPGPRDTKTSEIERTLEDLALQHPNSWQSKFAKFAIVNLLHTDGQDQRVIEIGEPMLVKGYFDIFDSKDDPQLALLKNAYPINSEIMSRGLLQQLIIAHKKLGNKTRMAELEGILQSSNEQSSLLPTNQTTSNQVTSIVTNLSQQTNAAAIPPQLTNLVQPQTNQATEEKVIVSEKTKKNLNWLGWLLIGISIVGLMIFTLIKKKGNE